tara:strand:+ start:1650 stop:2381 length:732 start_codon:yes stop_codon:yes gene_type:complete
MVEHSLSKKEITDLRLSVNPTRGIKNYERPLSPIQVMEQIHKLKESGLKNNEICELIDIDKSNITNYYTRMKALIPEVKELVSWGQTDSDRMKLGYTAVWHYSRFGEDGQKKLYQKALNKNVRRDEIRLMAQLFQRGFGSVEDCFDEIISRRGDEIKEELIIGKILDIILIEKLKDLNSDERDDLLEAALKAVKVYKKNKLKFTLGTEKFYLSLVPEGNSDIYIKIVANGFEESITKQLGKLL